MKGLRFLAIAGILTMVFPLASLASAKSAKEQRRKVAVTDQVMLAGKTLKPGSYQVEWLGSGPNVKVNFLQNGKTVLTAPARIAQLKEKAPYDAVIENTRKNGSKTISQIEWNHQREALRFGQGHANMQHSRKRAS